MKKNLKQLAAWLQIENQKFEDTVVTGISIDTRTIKQGDLFIPFRGEAVNGHRFVERAFEKGATASLWMKDEPNPPEHLPLIFIDDPEEALQQMAIAYRKEHKATFIGVTGSNGKTSSKDILAGTLSPYFKVQKTIGNFNNQLGLPITILQLDEDTEISVLEMGMSGFGEIEFLTKLARPHYAIITNIGEAHMQDLGSREGIAKAKFEIIQGLSEEGILFFDGDEPLLQNLVAKTPNLKTQSFGFTAGQNLIASNIVATAQGSSFHVEGEIEGDFFISVLGEHQVKNTLNTLLVSKAIGLTDEQIRSSLKQVVLTDMRMQLIPVGDLLFINDAYNAAPTSMRAAIQFVQQTTIRSEKWLVLGDMLELGDDEQHFHEEIATHIDAQKIDTVCLYGPRMKWLYDKLQAKMDATKLVYSEQSYAPILEKIKKDASAQTIILVKGSRGMQLETVIKGIELA
ncbi:UDP-N-acetylmuramoyl-tripeptide--D-alanyl-D-alanine ligase [Lysinibacillus sp. 2017]|uniref:UDP-N-acetylmuramoyl-tripeptide--D-alanyl-D- alanine ligase n=1 Tax=unclassified Lysinibacillus TaxID=2636778 RepID=UPI000D5289FA|nr:MULTISPECIES: UDP-N-acetylmuramoyl-tripeptide--D-alanyl-D-alanine ligase [unclassified Lysinibacillus]AWE08924.1 UDP-N-acetylmuramoyl-tripeptide--D-alanyl-D-alanine ligase [Lysinibacillus sp. 2017]TGN35566.1 UDP-N-acetylmuramoyl-tripeptide--D-alanyl-D-alanine ligase [Lysinibacillus sp. S2017]